LLDFDDRTTLPTRLPASTGCMFPSASSSNWRLWYTGHFTASRHSTSLMTCASLPTSQADNDYDQQALSSWRYPELGWLLLTTELSVLLDRGYGTVCRAMSLSVRLSLLFVENSNISFLVCLSLDTNCFLLLSCGPWGFYLGHVKKFTYNTIQYNNRDHEDRFTDWFRFSSQSTQK